MVGFAAAAASARRFRRVRLRVDHASAPSWYPCFCICCCMLGYCILSFILLSQIPESSSNKQGFVLPLMEDSCISAVASRQGSGMVICEGVNMPNQIVLRACGSAEPVAPPD